MEQERDHLQQQFRNTVTDDQLQGQRDQLDDKNRQLLAALDEKNALYDEIAENTKVLQNINNTIETNSEKIAQLKQEIEFMRSEFDEKERMMSNIEDNIDSQRNMLFDLKDEVKEKEGLIDQYTTTLNRKTKEEHRIEEEIREKDDII